MSRKWLLFFIFNFVLLSYLNGYPQRLLFSLSPQAGANLADAQDTFDSTELSAVFDNQLFAVPQYLAYDFTIPQVLGESTSNKRIEVDLTNQRLYAFEGDRMIYNFLISSGKWGRTPTGTFVAWTRLRYTKMSGGSKALRTYYYLPNVPYVMYFYNKNIPRGRGYGLHGTYWHNNFGKPMSHGCINMKTEEAGLIYNWIEIQSKDNPGTPIVIYGKAPM